MTTNYLPYLPAQQLLLKGLIALETTNMSRYLFIVSNHRDVVGIHMQTDDPMGIGCRHTITITLEMNQARSGNPDSGSPIRDDQHRRQDGQLKPAQRSTTTSTRSCWLHDEAIRLLVKKPAFIG